MFSALDREICFERIRNGTLAECDTLKGLYCVISEENRPMAESLFAKVKQFSPKELGRALAWSAKKPFWFVFERVLQSEEGKIWRDDYGEAFEWTALRGNRTAMEILMAEPRRIPYACWGVALENAVKVEDEAAIRLLLTRPIVRDYLKKADSLWKGNNKMVDLFAEYVPEYIPLPQIEETKPWVHVQEYKRREFYLSELHAGTLGGRQCSEGLFFFIHRKEIEVVRQFFEKGTFSPEEVGRALVLSLELDCLPLFFLVLEQGSGQIEPIDYGEALIRAAMRGHIAAIDSLMKTPIPQKSLGLAVECAAEAKNEDALMRLLVQPISEIRWRRARTSVEGHESLMALLDRYKEDILDPIEYPLSLPSNSFME